MVDLGHVGHLPQPHGQGDLLAAEADRQALGVPPGEDLLQGPQTSGPRPSRSAMTAVTGSASPNPDRTGLDPASDVDSVLHRP
jgi:hypothetical protein